MDSGFSGSLRLDRANIDTREKVEYSVVS